MLSKGYGFTFLLGVAAGGALTSPDVRRAARPLIRKFFQEAILFKQKVERTVASAGEDFEDFVAEVKAEHEAAAADVASADAAKSSN